jgi:hypothetical protein
MHYHPKVDVTQARKFWKDYTHGLYKAPRAWAHKGENLFHAFEAVAAASVTNSWHLDMLDQALMLAGMSAEVQLKAILVSLPSVRKVVTSTKPSKSDPAIKLWNRFFSHNLSELAIEAGISLTMTETRTALALSQYIYWRGRYVVPTERAIDDFIPVVLNNGLAGHVHQVSVQEARALIDRIIVEVKARLY